MNHKQLNSLTKHATARRGLVGAGIGGALGATAGALYGGFRKKEEDESRLEAILKGLAGGGLVGAGAGGLIGLATSPHKPNKSVTSTEWSPYKDMRRVRRHRNLRLSDNPTKKELQNWINQGLEYTEAELGHSEVWPDAEGIFDRSLNYQRILDDVAGEDDMLKFREDYDPDYSLSVVDERWMTHKLPWLNNRHIPPHLKVESYLNQINNDGSINTILKNLNGKEFVESLQRASDNYKRQSQLSAAGKP
jgi:hypothetical protein